MVIIMLFCHLKAGTVIFTTLEACRYQNYFYGTPLNLCLSRDFGSVFLSFPPLEK